MGAGILLAPWGWSSCQKETLGDTDKAAIIIIIIAVITAIIISKEAGWGSGYGHCGVQWLLIGCVN